MSEKKYVLFIVEGKSDRTFYGEYFNDLISKNNLDLDIKVTGGDILPKKVDDPVNLIKDAFYEELGKTKLKETDFVKIIQICDTDGSYFSEEQFVVDDRKEYYDKSYLYSPYGKPNIYVRDQASKEYLINKWKTKYQNQTILSKQESIKMDGGTNIPYRLFYVSLFLEHLLKNDPLIDPHDKRDCVEDYLEYNDIDSFIELLKSKKNSDNFGASWEIIEQKKGDYTPSSNLNILVDKLQNDFVEQ